MKVYSTQLKTLGAVGAGSLLVASLAAGTVLAQTTSGEYPDIVENIATTFNLDVEQVQQVFENTRNQHQEERLDKLVEEGTITEEQKELIIAKRAEMRTQMESIKDNTELTDEERREQMKALHEEFQTWAEENGIDISFGKGHRRGLKSGEFGMGGI